MRKVLGVICILTASPAVASDFDTCILSHMQQVSSDFAAKEIKKSCLRMSESEISREKWPTLAKWTINFDTVSYSMGYPSWVAVAHIDNDTRFAITEMTVNVTHLGVAKTYVIQSFNDVEHWKPGDPITVGLPPDPTWHMIMHHGLSQFIVPVGAPTPAEIKAGEGSLTWDIVSMKGWIE